MILPIATYASETWTLTAELSRNLRGFENDCLRAILGKSRMDRNTTKSIRERLSVKSTILENIQSRRLKLFGHVNRRPMDSAIYRAYKDDFRGTRPAGRPAKRWSDQIRSDTNLPLLTAERNTMDRDAWRTRLRRGARGAIT